MSSTIEKFFEYVQSSISTNHLGYTSEPAPSFEDFISRGSALLEVWSRVEHYSNKDTNLEVVYVRIAQPNDDMIMVILDRRGYERVWCICVNRVVFTTETEDPFTEGVYLSSNGSLLVKHTKYVACIYDYIPSVKVAGVNQHSDSLPRYSYHFLKDLKNILHGAGKSGKRVDSKSIQTYAHSYNLSIEKVVADLSTKRTYSSKLRVFPRSHKCLFEHPDGTMVLFGIECRSGSVIIHTNSYSSEEIEAYGGMMSSIATVIRTNAFGSYVVLSMIEDVGKFNTLFHDRTFGLWLIMGGGEMDAVTLSSVHSDTHITMRLSLRKDVYLVDVVVEPRCIQSYLVVYRYPLGGKYVEPITTRRVLLTNTLQNALLSPTEVRRVPKDDRYPLVLSIWTDDRCQSIVRNVCVTSGFTLPEDIKIANEIDLSFTTTKGGKKYSVTIHNGRVKTTVTEISGIVKREDAIDLLRAISSSGGMSSEILCKFQILEKYLLSRDE